MRSHNQNQASRTNGAKSKGPLTQAGKANSAANANTHNLAGVGNLVLLSNESKVDFYNHQIGFIHRFQPVDIVEYDLVQKMIAASWRRRRIESMECALMEIEMERQKQEVDDEFEAIDAPGRQVLALFGTTDTSAAYNLLLRYAAAAGRAYASAYKILKDLQGDRFNRPSSDSPAFLPKESDTPPGASAEPSDNNIEASNSEAAGREDSNAQESRTTVNNKPVAFLTITPLIRRHPRPAAPVLPNENHSQNAKLPNKPKTAAAGANSAEHSCAA